jgi:hypothetical protein
MAAMQISLTADIALWAIEMSCEMVEDESIEKGCTYFQALKFGKCVQLSPAH